MSPLCQILLKAFSTSRKAATIRSPLLKLFMMDWGDSQKGWLSVDFALQKPDLCVLIKPTCSRSERSLCSMTLSNSFIIELLRLMGL